MSDKKNEMRENDPLQEKFAGIDRMVNAPADLVDAVKSGVPLPKAGIQYTPGYHVGKFAKAAIAYAVGVALFLGAILLLPRLFSEQTPVGTNTDETTVTTAAPTAPDPADELLLPHKLWEKILAEDNVTISWQDNHSFSDGSTLFVTTMWMRDSNRIYQKWESISSMEELSGQQEHYYDTETEVKYAQAEGIWIEEKSEGISWAGICNDPSLEEFFNTTYYTLIDGVYTVTKKGMDRYFMGTDIAKDYYDKMVWDYSLQDGVYTIRRMIREADGRISSRIELKISFGDAVVDFPHIHEFVSSENSASCTEDVQIEHSCTKCGLRYFKTVSALGHDFVNGICSRCQTTEWDEVQNPTAEKGYSDDLSPDADRRKTPDDK